MENKLSKQYCQNCYAPLKSHTKYCANCGQKHSTKHVSFWQLISEGFSSLFNLDSRIFRTIFALFQPGELTSEYFKGRQQSYVHPVRVLLVSTLALIALISFSIGEDNLEGNSKEQYNKLYGFYEKGNLITELDSLKTIAAQRFENQILATAVIDTLLHLVHADSLQEDTFYLEKIGDIVSFSNNHFGIAKKDLLLLSEEELLTHYQVDGFFKQLLWRQGIRIFRKGDRIASYLIGNLLWLVISMLLLFGVVLKLFYFRHKRYYVEHLVFSMHTHAFMFVLFGLQLFLLSWLSETYITLIFRISLILLAVYILFALKKYYGQSWRKTTFKFMFLHLTYMFLLGAMMTLAVLISFALF